MKKQVIRLTENDLYRIIKESVNRILKEDETYVDKLRRQDAEKRASWDAFENTSPYVSDENIPTELDNKDIYDINKSHHKYISNYRPEKDGFRHNSYFANDDPHLKGFRGMQALDDNAHELYRNREFWSGKK